MVLSFDESNPNMDMSSTITMPSLSVNARGRHSNLRPTIDNSWKIYGHNMRLRDRRKEVARYQAMFGIIDSILGVETVQDLSVGLRASVDQGVDDLTHAFKR